MEHGSVFPPPPPIDPLLQARLDRLTSRRARPEPAGTSRTTPPKAPTRKRHAARRSRLAAVLMSVTSAAGLSIYFQQANAASAVDATPTTSAATTAAPTPSTAVAATALTPNSPAATVTPTSAAATPTTVAASTTGLADGTYAGSTDTNKWGPVQVQITVSGGQLTKVVALQTPTDDRKSITINQRATPTLASEALSAQGADIDTVSGATYTSESYATSLQSAIDLARTAALNGATS